MSVRWRGAAQGGGVQGCATVVGGGTGGLAQAVCPEMGMDVGAG